MLYPIPTRETLRSSAFGSSEEYLVRQDEIIRAEVIHEMGEMIREMGDVILRMVDQ